MYRKRRDYFPLLYLESGKFNLLFSGTMNVSTQAENEIIRGKQRIISL